MGRSTTAVTLRTEFELAHPITGQGNMCLGEQPHASAEGSQADEGHGDEHQDCLNDAQYHAGLS